MKKVILAFAISATFVSCGASATDWLPATRGELKSETAQRIEGDKNLQSQITQHGYEINTQAKYTTSVNEDLQASKAAGAAAYGEVKGQLGQQQTQINAVQDAAQQANVKGDANAVRLDGVEKNLGAVQGAAQAANDRATALEGRADATEGAIRDTNTALSGAVATQTGINGQVQSQISATNGKVKTVETKVDANKAAQDKVNTAQANTNTTVQGQIKAVDGRVTALDGKVEANANAQASVNANQAGVNKEQAGTNALVQDQVKTLDSNTNKVNDKLTETIGVVNQHTGQINAIGAQTNTNTANIKTNSLDIVGLKATTAVHTGQIQNQIKVTNAHTQTLIDHDARISGTEQVNARQDVQLGQHATILNEYGQRLDNQEAMSSRFAGDLGNLKSEVAGMNDRINSADRKAEKALNAAAGALSVASIQFNTDVEAGFQVGAGVATLAGKNAAAVGVGGAINNKWFVSGYATQAGSASGAAVSATYSMGR